MGTHPITAQYLGDANFNGSTSGTLNHSVLGPAPNITSIAPTSANKGQNNVLFNITGTNFQAGATVTVTYPSPGGLCLNPTNGVTVVNGSTTVTATNVQFRANIASNAAGNNGGIFACSRSRTVTVTNPDGQSDSITITING
jgi:hypothetical protein